MDVWNHVNTKKAGEGNVALEKHLLINSLNCISTNSQIAKNQAKFNRVHVFFCKSDTGKYAELHVLGFKNGLQMAGPVFISIVASLLSVTAMQYAW